MENPPSKLVKIESNISENDLINAALSAIERRFTDGPVLTSPENVRDYLVLKLADKDHEVFVCIFLDNKNRVICYKELFHGTIDQVSVYPRVVVKMCLEMNSSAIIVAHNHPSNTCKESPSDVAITKRLKESLSLIDVRLLDHLIVGGSECLSLAERGYL